MTTLRRIAWPKRRKPLARNSRPIQRKTRPRKQRKSCRAALGRLADKLFSILVRRHGCHAAQVDQTHKCNGPLQCAHVVSRSYRSVRWDEDNAMPLCAGAHVKYTHDPLGWEDFVDQFWHIGRGTLKTRAQVKWDGDIEGVVERLKQRVGEEGLAA